MTMTTEIVFPTVAERQAVRGTMILVDIIMIPIMREAGGMVVGDGVNLVIVRGIGKAPVEKEIQVHIDTVTALAPMGMMNVPDQGLLVVEVVVEVTEKTVMKMTGMKKVINVGTGITNVMISDMLNLQWYAHF